MRRRGVDTRDNILLNQGRVAGVLCDLASAKRLDKTSTGNATRDGYEALPQIGAHNLYLAPGTASVDQVVGGVGRGLWVWGFTGWWIGLDPGTTNSPVRLSDSGSRTENRCARCRASPSRASCRRSSARRGHGGQRPHVGPQHEDADLPREGDGAVRDLATDPRRADLHGGS